MAKDVFVYQDEGAKFLAPRARNGLFDAMGVGKTATAIRTQDYRQAWYGMGKEGIVICPASIRENWRKEWLSFQCTPRRIIKVNSIYDLNAWFKGHYDVALISFERAASFSAIFARECKLFDFCIIDEAHYLKSPASSRAQSILGPEFNGIGGIAQWAAYADWITGTPAPNDPADLWTWLRFLNGPMNLSLLDFKKRYFSCTLTQYGSRSRAKSGAPLAELQSIISANSIARSMADVGIHLPPIMMTTINVDGDTKELERLLTNHPGLDERIIKTLQGGGDLSGLEDEQIAALRRLVGEAKALPYAHLLANDFASGLDKVVVFGHHRIALKTIAEHLARKGIQGVMIQGGTSDKDRDAAVDAFNNDPKCRYFIGNHRAAGVGLNLQKECCMVDIFESDWTPTANAQSIKRVARFGQTRNMRARFVALTHWLEESIQQINADKTARILALGLPELL